jgi:hypothetical protein
MPRKVFTAGEVLAAADVNNFLMDQSVMTFAGTAARGSAIGTATEGMLTYLSDTDTYQFWNGTAWTGLSGGGSGSGNAIINGAFEINQRNFTSSTVSNAMGFDRFRFNYTSGTTTYSAETFTLGSAPVAGYEARNFARLAVTGQTGTNANSILRQPIESVRTFAGQTVNVSFWAKANTGTPSLAVELTQNFGSGGSPSADVNAYAGKITLSTSWTRYSLSVAVPSISGKTIGTDSNDSLLFTIWVSAGSDFNARTGTLGLQNATFDFWGVQVEAGSTATPFRRNANSIQGELAACQRYFYRLGSEHNSFGSGSFADSLNSYHQVRMLVPMRTSPTISFSAVGTFKHAVPGVVDVTLTNIIASNPRAYDFQVVASSGSNAAFQTGRGATFFSGGSATIDVSAEL